MKSHNIKFQVDKLYNKILILSRYNYLYTNLDVKDTFQNRISLIFLHVSFLFNKIKSPNKSEFYQDFYQKMFDHIFKKIEINMREIGYGDLSVNKNMKFLSKIFYDILLNCENYKFMNFENKMNFLSKHLDANNKENYKKNAGLIDYFDKYQVFCLDLSSDKVLKGDLNFSYK